MPKLNKLSPRQEAYCVERARGLIMLEAYTIAYPNSKASKATKNREAKRLEAQTHIAARIGAIKAATKMKAEKAQKAAEIAVEKKLALDAQRVLEELWDNAQQAKAAVAVKDHKGNPTGMFTANWQASNAALIALGKHFGMFSDAPKKQDPLSDLTHEELIALRDMAQDISDGHAAESAGATGKPGPKRGQRTTH